MPARYFCLLLSLFWFSVVSAANDANSTEFVKNYLVQISRHSAELKALSLEEKSSALALEGDLTQFDSEGYLSAAVTDSDDPPVSPFSSESTNRKEYGLGVSKLWNLGVTTSLDYTLVDNLTRFPSRDPSDYYSPKLSLTLETSLFQDMLSGRLKLVEPKLMKEKSVISLQTKIQKKTVLIDALLRMADILEIGEAIQLQKDLCQETTRQTSKMAERRQRGSVSQREYLINRKDKTTCLAAIKTLEKDLYEKRQDLLAKYGVDPSGFVSPGMDKVFAEVASWYYGRQFDVSKVEVNHLDEIVVLKTNLDVYEINQKQLDALKKPDVDFSVETGLAGLNNQISDAHQDLGDTSYPYVKASVKVTFPFAGRDAKVNSAVNSFKTEAVKLRLEQLQQEKQARFQILRQTLEREYEVYRDYKENVDLSEQVLREARRDFNNGRIDFFSLSEFQKRLIESQRQLAGLRTQIVIKTVEYVDYFHFFDEYF